MRLVLLNIQLNLLSPKSDPTAEPTFAHTLVLYSNFVATIRNA